jgi:viroplasmin and RNaseH domain-containing protein
VGRKVGVFDNWAAAENQVKGYPEARHRKFRTLSEAESFLNEYSPELKSSDLHHGNEEPRDLLGKPFYAVARGRKTGIFRDWKEMNLSVQGFNQAKFRKFETEEEARAFLGSGPKIANPRNQPQMVPPSDKHARGPGHFWARRRTQKTHSPVFKWKRHYGAGVSLGMTINSPRPARRDHCTEWDSPLARGAAGRLVLGDGTTSAGP